MLYFIHIFTDMYDIMDYLMLVVWVIIYAISPIFVPGRLIVSALRLNFDWIVC